MKSDPLHWRPGQLYAYTDGATFRQQPGPISWAVVFVRDGAIAVDARGRERVYAAAGQRGSNNRAELMGVIWALRNEQTEDLVVVSDAETIVKAALGESKRRSNKDLWEQFDQALNMRRRRGLRTEFVHVAGHGDDRFNREADIRAAQPALENYELIRKGLQCASSDEPKGNAGDGTHPQSGADDLGSRSQPQSMATPINHQPGRADCPDELDP